MSSEPKTKRQLRAEWMQQKAKIAKQKSYQDGKACARKRLAKELRAFFEEQVHRDSETGAIINVGHLRADILLRKLKELVPEITINLEGWSPRG